MSLNKGAKILCGAQDHKKFVDLGLHVFFEMSASLGGHLPSNPDFGIYFFINESPIVI